MAISDGFLLGFDVGSSSIKAALLTAETGELVASASSPETELAIEAARPGWAEQNPALWWDNAVAAVAILKATAAKELASVSAIGISYQMHGLVIIDKAGKVLRPSIIWCDSRAVDIGSKAFKGIGEQTCLNRLLNSPGNFTASTTVRTRWRTPSTSAPISAPCTFSPVRLGQPKFISIMSQPESSTIMESSRQDSIEVPTTLPMSTAP